jgi:EmrB/QacA subfamily drug resistance transporter
MPDPSPSPPPAGADRARWIALAVLCLGTLMIVIDATIVNVALPSIRADLDFTETTLTWVVNAYLLVFGGFLLLGGRLGDLFGARRVFVLGIAAFSAASLACGLAPSQGFLVVARAVQGLGGAVVDAVSLALIVRLFPEPAGRARAMGVYGFVCAAGGSIGVLAGGLLTGAFSWHWIFLVNVPIGVGVIALCFALLPATPGAGRERLDVGGAVTVTAALLLAVYAVIDGNVAGWLSAQTLGLLGAAAVLFAAFLAIESRVRSPLVPLAMFRLRNVAVANVVGVLWSAGMFAWFFISALYLQLVLGYSPMQVGLAFLPSNLLMAACSLGISAALVNRFGIRRPLAGGLALGAIGLALFARAPVDGTFVVDVLPGMLLLGLAGGIAFNPLLLAAVSDVREDDAGLASGLVNTAFMMGGALGLAVLASIAAAGTGAAAAAGAAGAPALASGYRLAFAVGAAATGLAAVLSLLLRPAAPQAAAGADAGGSDVPEAVRPSSAVAR